MKKLISIMLCLCLLFSLVACGNAPVSSPKVESTVEPTSESTPELTPEPLIDKAALALDLSEAQWEKSADGSYYQLLDVHFCTNVLAEKYQTMNIYVPAEYFEGGEVCGYTAETAPIVLMNNCSGWRSGSAGNADKTMIENGFVFVNCGARSRGAGDNGEGKAPAPVVDLKSALRTLRLNSDVIPGDEEKIISIGTSGGGEMSSILGASGNMEEYYSYLYENGAPGLLYDEANDTYISTINDDVYGCMCYCPIADIENADLAYAWWRYGCGDTGFAGMFGGNADFTEFQIALERDLAVAFCEYINSLGIINEEGESLGFDVTSADKEMAVSNPRIGSFYEQILENMSDALNAFIAGNTDAEGSFSYTKSAGRGHRGPGGSETTTYDSLEAYLASLGNTAEWLVKNEDGTYSVTDMAGFLTGTALSRNKDIPGFDTFDLSAENNAFGTADEEAVHYSASVAAVLEANYERYSQLEGFEAAAVDAYIEQANREDLAQQTYLMNATAIMLDTAAGEQDADFADHWRTRNGTADEHTCFSVAYNLAMSALMAGAESVDYALVWAMHHGSDEGTSTGTFTEWVHSICG